jgi:hypothetical protein
LALFEKLCSEIREKREESFAVNGHMLWRNNIRYHNLQFSELMRGRD